MKILILGGTIFLGRYLVEAALAQGHEVTLFNRGEHNPHLFPDLVKFRGDRDGDLSALAGRQWDAVIDTCGYVPRIVAQSAALLAEQVAHYTFVSSISVYTNFRTVGIDESAAVGMLDDPEVEEITGDTYGPLKALCERTVEEAMPGRSLHVRPGLIVGPHDPTDRFTYWPVRVAQGGDVLAPAGPNAPTQFVDVRDLAAWMVHMVESHETGIYNATGPTTPLGDVLETSRAVSGSDARFVWASQEFLLAQEVQPWQEMTLWVPDDGEMAGFASVDVGKATAAGLTHRPLAEIIGDTLAWAQQRPADHTWRAGLTLEREQALLDALGRA